MADVREESLDPVHRAAHCLCLPGPQLQGTDVKTDPMLLHCPKSVHGAMDWAEALLAHTCQCGLLRRLPVPQCCRPEPGRMTRTRRFSESIGKTEFLPGENIFLKSWSPVE